MTRKKKKKNHIVFEFYEINQKLPKLNIFFSNYLDM